MAVDALAGAMHGLLCASEFDVDGQADLIAHFRSTSWLKELVHSMVSRHEQPDSSATAPVKFTIVFGQCAPVFLKSGGLAEMMSLMEEHAHDGNLVWYLLATIRMMHNLNTPTCFHEAKLLPTLITATSYHKTRPAVVMEMARLVDGAIKREPAGAVEWIMSDAGKLIHLVVDLPSRYSKHARVAIALMTTLNTILQTLRKGVLSTSSSRTAFEMCKEVLNKADIGPLLVSIMSRFSLTGTIAAVPVRVLTTLFTTPRLADLLDKVNLSTTLFQLVENRFNRRLVEEAKAAERAAEEAKNQELLAQIQMSTGLAGREARKFIKTLRQLQRTQEAGEGGALVGDRALERAGELFKAKLKEKTRDPGKVDSPSNQKQSSILEEEEPEKGTTRGLRGVEAARARREGKIVEELPTEESEEEELEQDSKLRTVTLDTSEGGGRAMLAAGESSVINMDVKQARLEKLRKRLGKAAKSVATGVRIAGQDLGMGAR